MLYAGAVRVPLGKVEKHAQVAGKGRIGKVHSPTLGQGVVHLKAEVPELLQKPVPGALPGAFLLLREHVQLPAGMGQLPDLYQSVFYVSQVVEI